jgi:hypothetical protein
MFIVYVAMLSVGQIGVCRLGVKCNVSSGLKCRRKERSAAASKCQATLVC